MADQERIFSRPLLKKLGIWGGVAGLLFLLRDFFPLLLMTFVLSYMGLSFMKKAEPRLPRAWMAPTLFFLLLAGLLASFVAFSVPRIVRGVRSIQEQAALHPSWTDYIDARLLESLGDRAYGILSEELGDPEPGPGGLKSVARGILGQITEEDRGRYLRGFATFGKSLWSGVVYVFLSGLFSYLFLLGLPSFKEGVRALESSHLREAYREVAPSIARFGVLMGRAFEAQTWIAVVNTVITAIGMVLLGIPHLEFLSVVVFLCSFIPVAGVFISTAPICLAAFAMEGGGLVKAGGVIAMVVIAHALEAYVLNPRIYGRHMKMNPLAVLFVLVLAEHLVGIWGLVVGVPVATYVWRHLILGEELSP